ncbi:MAG: energy-coupling factor ABC transporter permease [Bacillota bacterium]
MHIPDGFLNAQTWAPAYLLSAGAIGYGIKKSREELNERQVPRLGVMAAFIFAAQMINFPVAGVASGHLLGAALAAILLGPWSACIIISTVLVIQMLIFQDGGLTVLGANILNMAVMGVIASYLVYSIFSRALPGAIGRNISIFLAAWFSVMVTALMGSLELGLSYSAHQVSFDLILKALLGWHAIIGIGEGIITVGVVSFMEKVGFSEKAGVSSH